MLGKKFTFTIKADDMNEIMTPDAVARSGQVVTVVEEIKTLEGLDRFTVRFADGTQVMAFSDELRAEA